MRVSLVMAWMLGIAGTGLAQELGNSRGHPDKPQGNQAPAVLSEDQQAGDTVDDPYSILELPFVAVGTTAGYADDYDWVCPFDAMSPDVVYSIIPDHDLFIEVDLCGSLYDTKTFIFNSHLNVIACNDDFYFDDTCGPFVSKIEEAFLPAGEPYYIVIDGYGGGFGDYLLNVREVEPCRITCPVDAVAEGEPALHDGYVDLFNPGCNTMYSGGKFQRINWTNDSDGLPPFDGQAWLCGKSGWYIGNGGAENRDTDWFQVFARETGVMEVTVEAEYPSFLFKLAPLDCSVVGIELQAVADCENRATLSFPVSSGEEIWLWLGPVWFTGPVTEFTYSMTVNNNEFDVVSTEARTWGEVKALYR